MRTLAIGDIHGCWRALAALETFAGITVADRVVTLGDYVDRGPDSRRVIEWLIEHDAIGHLVALRGNHEVMMLAARESSGDRREWLLCGGDAALASYGIRDLHEIPRAHWTFLATRLRSHFVGERHFFVHANASADVPFDEQPDQMLYWEFFRDPPPHESGLTMVCGHTPQEAGLPLDIGHAVCIDTGACERGWLTCLDVDSGTCWQANEAGETRRFWLGDRP